MVDRLGTVRGAIGFAFLVCTLNFIMHMMLVFGVPAIEEGDWNAMLQSYKDGSLDPAAAAQDFVWKTMGIEPPEHLKAAAAD
jgi:hypothetical protein